MNRNDTIRYLKDHIIFKEVLDDWISLISALPDKFFNKNSHFTIEQNFRDPGYILIEWYSCTRDRWKSDPRLAFARGPGERAFRGTFSNADNNVGPFQLIPGSPDFTGLVESLTDHFLSDRERIHA